MTRPTLGADAVRPAADAPDGAEPSVTTVPLGGSALSRWIQGRSAPVEWRVNAPASPQEWAERIGSTQDAFAGMDWWSAIAPAVTVGGPGRERLERVAAARGVVVTTGQQPGLFGGPLYTLNKALSALALADEIERVTGVPAAPLFWAATDDADLAEVQRVWLSLQGGARELRGTAEARAGTPASAVRQGGLEQQLLALREASGSALHSAILDATERAYGDPRETIGNAYVSLMEAVLAPLGIAVIDASHTAVSRAGSGIMQQVLAQAEACGTALRDRSDDIRSRGFEPQVDDVAGLTPVFVYAGAAKRRVRVAEAAAVASRADDTALGPNVLLRPVLEAAILPTVTYVAGPGELAYFPQVTALADAIGARTPLAVPRWSGVIVEPRVRRLLSRIGVRSESLADPHAVERALARGAMPDPLAAALVRAANATADNAAAIGTADTTHLIPPPVLEGLHKRLAHQFERIERRTLAAVKRREAMRMLDVATARGYFFPEGKPQERALSFVPFLARCGPALLAAMLGEARRHAAALVSGGAGTGGIA